MSAQGLNRRSRVTLSRASYWLSLSILLSISAFCPPAALASGPDETGTFRWIHENSDPQLWQTIQTAFTDVLAPDSSKQGQDELDAFHYKYLQKVGLVNHSALVIVGHRPGKEITKENEWDEYHTAFNFDLETQKKSTIEHAEWMWKWKFIRLAKFGPSSVPDVTFNYYTCTECEPEIMFASLYYDAPKSAWQIRPWGDGKDLWWTGNDGLVVDMDVDNGGDTFSYDCVYGIVDLHGDGFQNVVIRCKEITLNETGRAKIEDSTVLYSLSDGQFRPRRVTDPSESLGLTAKVCKPTIQSWLCRLPGYMTATSDQNYALDQMFPKARAACREFKYFRSIKKTMSMEDVVRQAGVPDELGGSGIAIFIYHLDDGSLVAIGAIGPTGPLLYASHIAPTGKVSELFPAE
jgi:hypothetical protein